MPGAAALTGYFPGFLLVLLRSSVFLAFLPVLGSRNLPGRFRIGLAVAIAALLAPVVDLRQGENGVVLLVLREVVLGMALGLAVRSLFFAVEIAGQMISDAMGLSIATVFNPEIGQSTEIARLLAILATLLFLVTDAHHELIAVFVRSYELVPPGAGDVRALAGEAVAIVGRLFLFAVKLSAPVLVGMVTLHILLGFISKATPQINIFFIGFPLYIAVGFLILLLALPAYVGVIGGSFAELRAEMGRVLAAGGR